MIGGAVTNSGGYHHSRYGYHYHNGNSAQGAIIGGAIGAIAGGAIASGSCY